MKWGRIGSSGRPQLSVMWILYPNQVVSRFSPVCASGHKANESRPLRLLSEGLLAIWLSPRKARNTAARLVGALAHSRGLFPQLAHQCVPILPADEAHPLRSVGPERSVGFRLSASVNSLPGGYSAQTSRE